MSDGMILKNKTSSNNERNKEKIIYSLIFIIITNIIWLLKLKSATISLILSLFFLFCFFGIITHSDISAVRSVFSS